MPNLMVLSKKAGRTYLGSYGKKTSKLSIFSKIVFLNLKYQKFKFLEFFF